MSRPHLPLGRLILPVLVLVVSGCGLSATPGAPSGSTDPTVAATSTGTLPSPSAEPSATDTAAASESAGASVAGATATALPVTHATARPRGPWATGQTVIADYLVAPYTGWVRTNRGIYQTIDDGVSWENATPARLIVSKIRGLGALDANRAMLAVADVGATTTTYYIWRTTDAGANWAYVALPPMPHDPPCPASDPGCMAQPGDPEATFDYVSSSVAYVSIIFRQGVDGFLDYEYRTADGGRSWTRKIFSPAPTDTRPSAYPELHFLDGNRGVVVNGEWAYGTTTGWGSWAARPITDGVEEGWDEYRPSLVDPAHWYMSGKVDSHGAFLYAFSSDQGRTWVRRSGSGLFYASEFTLDLQFIDTINWVANVRTTAGTADGPTQTFMTGDGGAHWTRMGPQPVNGSSAYWLDLVHGWSGPTDGVSNHRLYATRDSGVSWTLITP